MMTGGWVQQASEWLSALPVSLDGWLDSIPAFVNTAPIFQFIQAMLLLCLVLLAQAKPPRGQMSRFLMLALTVVASANAALAGMSTAGEFPKAAQELANFLCLFGGFWIVAKVAHAHRFAALRDARHPGSLLPPATDLPSQAAFLAELRGMIRGASLSSGTVLGIKGRWGSAKSYLLDRLLQTLPHPPAGELPCRCVAVKVNVWEYQNYGDLQWGILQALYAHPESLVRFGWMGQPVMAVMLAWLRMKLVRVKLSLFNGAVEGDAHLRLAWQEHLEKAVGRLAARGFRVVVALDEIDRAAAPSAQSALTLVHRSLNLPGVVVLLPYVREQVREKAFNPFVLELEDLKATAFAWFVSEMEKVRRQPKAEKESAVSQVPPGNDPYAGLGGLPKPGDWERIFRKLSLAWAASPEYRESYYRAMEGKYLRLHKEIPPLSAADLLGITGFPLVFGRIAHFGEEGARCMEAWLEKRYSRLHGNERLTVRNVLGEWMALLDKSPWEGDDHPEADHCLAIVIDRAKQDEEV